MSFLDTDQGKDLLEQYLSKYKGGSQRVYRSEIQQFYAFREGTNAQVSEGELRRYQDKLAQEHSQGTAKRKFSILNGFF